MDQLIEINSLEEYEKLFKQNQSSYLQLLGVLIVCLSNLL